MLSGKAVDWADAGETRKEISSRIIGNMGFMKSNILKFYTVSESYPKRHKGLKIKVKLDFYAYLIDRIGY